MCGSIVNVKIGVIALTAIGVVVRDVDANRSHRIIEGEKAGPNEFPWISRIHWMDRDYLNHECVGVITNSRFILTTVHCLQNPNAQSSTTSYDARDYNITLRSSYVEIEQHPKYFSFSGNGIKYIVHDIAVVVLNKDLQLDENQDTILLPDKPTVVGTHAVLSGWWKITDEGMQDTRVLQKIPTTILHRDRCSDITIYQLCGRSRPTGDAGSPLVVDGRIVGILSTVQAGVENQATYTDLYYYRDWIMDVVNKYV